MKQFRVFVRNEARKFEEWEDHFNVSFNEGGLEDVTVWSHEHPNERQFHGNTRALFADIDPDNVLPDCECVVCEMVTDDLCEGDIVDVDGSWKLITWDDVENAFMFYGAHPLDNSDPFFWSQTDFDGPPIERLGHILTHRINDGDVVKR